MADLIVTDEKNGAMEQPVGNGRVPAVYADASWNDAVNGYTVIAAGDEVGPISYGVNAFDNVASALAAMQDGDSICVFGLQDFNVADYDFSGITGTIYLSNGSFIDSEAKQTGDFRWDENGRYIRKNVSGSVIVGESVAIYALTNFENAVISGGAVVSHVWGGSFWEISDPESPQVYTTSASGSLVVTGAAALDICGYETVTLNAGAEWQQIVGGWCGSPEPLDWHVIKPSGMITVTGVDNTIAGNSMIGYAKYDVVDSVVDTVKVNGTANTPSTLLVGGVSSLKTVDLSFGTLTVDSGAAAALTALTVSGGGRNNSLSGKFSWSDGSSLAVATGAALVVSADDFAQLAGAATITVDGAIIIEGDISWSVLSDFIAASGVLDEIIVEGNLTGVDGPIELTHGKGKLAALSVTGKIQGDGIVQVSVASGSEVSINLAVNSLDDFEFANLDGTLEIVGDLTWTEVQGIVAEAGSIGTLVISGSLSGVPEELSIGGDNGIGSLFVYRSVGGADFVTVDISSGGSIMLPEVTCNMAVNSEDGTGSAFITPMINDSGCAGLVVRDSATVALNVPLLAAATKQYGAEIYWVSEVVVESGAALWLNNGIDMSAGMENFVIVEGFLSISGICRSTQQMTLNKTGVINFTSSAVGGGANLNCLVDAGGTAEVVIDSGASIAFAMIEVEKANDNSHVVISGSFSSFLGIATAGAGSGNVSIAFDGSNLANFGGDEAFIVTFDGLVTLNGSATELAEINRVMEQRDDNYIRDLEIAGDLTGVDSLTVGGGGSFRGELMVDGNLVGGGSGTITTLQSGMVVVDGAVTGIKEVATTDIIDEGTNGFLFQTFEGIDGGSTLTVGNGCMGIVGTLKGTVAITVNGGCYLGGVESGATTVTGMASNHGGFTVASGAAFTSDFFFCSDLVTVAGEFTLTGNSRDRSSTLYDVALNAGTLTVGARSEAFTNSIQVSGGRSVISGVIYWADDDSAKFTVDADSELAVGADQLGELLNAGTIMVAGTLTVDADLDWSTVQTVKTNYDIAMLNIDGTIYNTDKMMFDNGVKFEIGADFITGTSRGDRIVVGASANVALASNIDLRGGANTLTVQANAEFITGGLVNTGKVSIYSGKAYKNDENVGVQGFTNVSIGGEWSGSGNSSFTVGNFCTVMVSGDIHTTSGSVSLKLGRNSSLLAGWDVYVTSLTISDSALYTSEGKTEMGTTLLQTNGVLRDADGKAAVKVGKLSQMLIDGIAFDDDRNSLSMSAGARVVADGSVTGINTLIMASSTTYKDASGEKQTAYCRFRVGGNFSGTSYNDSIRIGAGAAGHVAGWLDLLGGRNTLSVGSNAEFLIGNSLTGVTSFTLSSGRVYTDSSGVKTQGTTQVWAESFFASQGNATVSLGGFSSLKVSKYFGCSLNGGTVKASVGGQSKLLVGGDAAGIARLALSSGKYVENMVGGELLGYTVAEFGGGFTGTVGNDTVSAGNYCAATFGSVDLGKGRNTINFGNNSRLRLNGALDNLYSARFGKNCTIEASTEAIEALYALGKNFKIGSGTVIIDIGEAAIAANFTTAYREVVVDAGLDSNVELGDGAAGWLSNKNYSGSQGVEDLRDFFKQASGEDLSGWYVNGGAGTLDVKVWRFDGQNWDGGTQVLEDAGSWNLGSVDVSGAADYRVSVEIADEAEKNVYAYTLSMLPV